MSFFANAAVSFCLHTVMSLKRAALREIAVDFLPNNFLPPFVESYCLLSSEDEVL